VSRARHRLSREESTPRINSERRSYDATPESPQPSHACEGTAWIVELERTDHRLAKPQKSGTCDEVDNLGKSPA
jgi:hypothetical protein